MAHRLRIAFEDAAVFRKEYERNIVNGGAFIHTAEAFQPRELVQVELELGFCGESVVLQAEIVNCWGADEAGSEPGGGVAVQFLEPASALRERLQRFLEESEPAEAELPEKGFFEAESAEAEFAEVGFTEAEPAEAEPAELGFADAESAEAAPAEVGFAEAESAEPAERGLSSPEDVSGLNVEGVFDESSVADQSAVPDEDYAPEESEEALFETVDVEFSQAGESEVPLAPAADRRKARRVHTRVQARVDAKSLSLEGRTRDISESGVLISADASGLPIGKAVNLELIHPVSGERLEVEGEISRHVETEGTVAAVGIEFGGKGVEGRVAAFLEDVSQVERELKRTGIYGAIEVLGIAALVRMFGTTAARGTLMLVSGVEEGSIGFENGMLRYVQMSELRGPKALSRLLAWEQGTFEFHAHLDPVDGEEDPIVLEEAIQEAIRQREELTEVGLTCRFEPTDRFSIDGKALLGESGLTKIEEAVLDLVAAGFSFRRILDVLPEPDAEVVKAVKHLLDGEIIRPA
jgi:Tfp pilus assembly protein PilZ